MAKKPSTKKKATKEPNNIVADNPNHKEDFLSLLAKATEVKPKPGSKS